MNCKTYNGCARKGASIVLFSPLWPQSANASSSKLARAFWRTRKGTTLDARQFKRLTCEISQVIASGHECVVVSSGAVAAGLGVLGLKDRPEELAARQACAAIGQSKLMQSYSSNFARHGLNVAQLLLTYSDLDSRRAYQNIQNTLARIFERRTVVPIINENDTVAVEELKFGDNDKLSAEVAVLVEPICSSFSPVSMDCWMNQGRPCRLFRTSMRSPALFGRRKDGSPSVEWIPSFKR